MHNHSKRGFTLVELLVIVVLISILSTLWMISYYHLKSDARDAVRSADMNNLISVISITEIKKWDFPRVLDPIEITFEWAQIWQQGTFWEDSFVDVQTLSNIPIDPLTGQQYTYSFSRRSKEFQVGGVFEASYESSFIPFVSQTHAKDFSSYDSSIVRGTFNGRFITHTKRLWILKNQIFILWTPSIISRNVTDSDIEDVLRDNNLVFDGKRAVAWNFRRDTNIQDENWEFTPGITKYGMEHDSKVVVYKALNTELSTTAWKQELVESLQLYYQKTDIRDTENIKNLLQHWNTDASRVVDSYINGKIWGLQNAWIQIK